MSTPDTEVLIIGAGVAGAATAHHLHRLGQTSVAILERESTPGQHSTGRNAAIIRDASVDEWIRPLLEEGADFIRTGAFAAYESCGLYMAGDPGEPLSARIPPAQGAGSWHPECGICDVAALLQRYLQGIDVRCETSVQDWRREGDDRLIVNTSHGAISCRTLVNAAGPWAGKLGGLPLQPLNRTLFVTTQLDWVDPAWPTVWHRHDGFYFRPESGGLLLCACDETPREPGDYEPTDEILEQLFEKMMSLQPDMVDVAISHQWVGQRTYAKDRNFVIGFDVNEPRLFHVAGLGGHGVTASYAVGRVAAEAILAGPDKADQTWSPRRFEEVAR